MFWGKATGHSQIHWTRRKVREIREILESDLGYSGFLGMPVCLIGAFRMLLHWTGGLLIKSTAFKIHPPDVSIYVSLYI